MTPSRRWLTRMTTWLGVVSIGGALFACEDHQSSRRGIYLGGQREAWVTTVRSETLPRTTTRTLERPQGAKTIQTALFDAKGGVVEATMHYVATARTRRLKRDALGLLLQDQDRSARIAVSTTTPVVLMGMLSEVTEPGPALFVDADAAESLPGQVRFDRGTIVASDDSGAVLRTILANGDEIGPGGFVVSKTSPRAFAPVAPTIDDWREGGPKVGDRLQIRPLIATSTLAADGNGQKARRTADALEIQWGPFEDHMPPTAAHRTSSLTIESDAPEFQPAPGAPQRTAAQDALALVEEIDRGLVRGPSESGPLSARRTQQRGSGDCDDATAVFVAKMRARGHAARAVVGYRLADGVATPHAWAEFWDGARWLSADTMWPQVGTIRRNLRLFDGLGSDFTLGQTLGRVTFALIPAPQVPAPQVPAPQVPAPQGVNK